VMPGHFQSGQPLALASDHPLQPSSPRICRESFARRRFRHELKVPIAHEQASSPRRVRPAPRRRVRQAVRASRPSAVPSSQVAMDPKVENEEHGRSPLAEFAQAYSSRSDLTNTVRNRGFGSTLLPEIITEKETRARA
jgi:hypothetical protein